METLLPLSNTLKSFDNKLYTKSTSNSSLQANLALVENNARVGAEIAKAYGA